ncbi:hypothetical protein LEP1GSC036_4621 [Leptospira weilii str. 2006001853]|uniref:Uncharacterized protein n=2 Tax=Leptospira weilii TaxID=28184 RepID=A0A828YZQ0_9LEPT|nr:hypothetical protein [Leptospira weilii]EKR63680.1 hypothetical protein LEP1GSC036_4621 [Leptospira weilii str. 2006001853]EMN44196.1 hypothetical protein LEP1GSC086_2908 [Leptospira weilii str. LNT 1234]EMN88706.1 hypothetical protein LEP1GSC108_1311 [Leptospira weilii str. UI 13098]MCL8265110.1 hypothetical protein [Leptospira weilii]OMI17111.1 hypothetical protein BUQ74_12100 [Leptospira weilii serovar Heyan]
MAKKDLLKQAASAHVRKTLGGETIQNESVASPSSSEPAESSNENVIASEEFVSSESETPHVEQNQNRSYNKESDSFATTYPRENSPIRNSSSSEAREEKHLPKKNHLHRISSVMRLEDYTRPESTEREGSSRFLKIAGIILLAFAIWFFWPAKHEIYMDIDKMTPEKVSGMSSQKEYHFSHGQDFFIYYKKGWSTPKRVRLSIYRTDGGKEEFSVQEKDFRKSFEKFQTYYDDTFFDQQGSYEVEIRDEDGELLVNKKFTID